jgi:hypothetical protein
MRDGWQRWSSLRLAAAERELEPAETGLWLEDPKKKNARLLMICPRRSFIGGEKRHVQTTFFQNKDDV